MNRTLIFSYLSSIVCVIALMVVFIFHDKPAVYDTIPPQTYRMVEDYTYSSTKDSSAVLGISQEYRFTLKDVPKSGGVILFYLSHQEVEVTIGDQLIYSIHVDEKNNISNGVGFGVARIPVYPEEEGETVCIKVQPIYKSSIVKKLSIYYGSYNMIALDIMRADLPILIICILCLLIGFVMVVFSIFEIIKLKGNFENFSIASFAFFTGLWKLTDLNMTSFFMNNSLCASGISILSMTIMVISFIFYLRYQVSEKMKKLWTGIGLLSCTSTFAIIILQITKIADLRETLFITHLMICVVTVFGIACILKEFHDGIVTNKLKAVFAGILLCIIGSFTDIISYYITHHSWNAFFGILAFFIYILYMGLISLHDIIALINQGKVAKHYADLALHDELTGLFSRIYFKQYIANHEDVTNSCHLIMFDVNNLKQCNDTKGHSSGDALLRNTAQLIKESFLPDGSCIRLSGDEFCVILENKTDNDVQKMLDDFTDSTIQFTNTHPDAFPIQVACGFASYDLNLDLDLNDTLKRADKKMYEMKHRMKQQ